MTPAILAAILAAGFLFAFAVGLVALIRRRRW